MKRRTGQPLGRRFKAKLIPALLSSIDRFGFDRRLFAVDVRASIAHCDGLVGAAC